MADADRRIAIIGHIGIVPVVRLSLPGRRLLAFLALKGQPVSRAIASTSLWPDAPDTVGRANLRRALWHLPHGWVKTVGDELVLDAENDLPAARGAASRALRSEPITFEEISTLSNDILPGWHEEWALDAQDAFLQLRLQALEAACRTMTAAGDFALAIQAGAAAVAADPLRESAAEALICAHLAQRNRYAAALCFQSLARRLQKELGVAPDPALSRRLNGINLPDHAAS